MPADLDELQFFLWDQKAGTLDDLVLRMRKLDDAQLASAVQRGFITTALTSNKAKTLVAITAWMSTAAVTARYPTLRQQVRLLQEICDRDLGNATLPSSVQRGLWTRRGATQRTWRLWLRGRTQGARQGSRPAGNTRLTRVRDERHATRPR